MLFKIYTHSSDLCIKRFLRLILKSLRQTTEDLIQRGRICFSCKNNARAIWTDPLLDSHLFKDIIDQSISTGDELLYLRTQFELLEPNNGCVSLYNFRTALIKNATDAIKKSGVADILNLMEPLSYKKMDFEEFCAAAISVYRLETHEKCEDIASSAYQYFQVERNRITSVTELSQE